MRIFTDRLNNDIWKLQSRLDELLTLCETRYKEYNHFRSMPPEKRISYGREVLAAKQNVDKSIDELYEFIVSNDLHSNLTGKVISTFTKTQLQLRFKRGGQGVKQPNIPIRPPEPIPGPNPLPDEVPEIVGSLASLRSLLEEQYDFRGLIGHLKDHFSKGSDGVSCGNERLDNLIRTALKNGELTPIEREFIIQKANEYECDPQLVLKTVAATHKRNPVIEDVVRAILSDGLVTDAEIAFLKAKAGELSTPEFEANRWWWGIGLEEYEHLWRQSGAFSGFVVVLSVWMAIDKLGWAYGKSFNIDVLFDIYSGDSIQEVFNQAYFSLCEKFRENGRSQEDLDILFEDMYSSLPTQQIDEEVEGGGLRVGQEYISLDMLMGLLKEVEARVGSSEASLVIENIIYGLPGGSEIEYEKDEKRGDTNENSASREKIVVDVRRSPTSGKWQVVFRGKVIGEYRRRKTARAQATKYAKWLSIGRQVDNHNDEHENSKQLVNVAGYDYVFSQKRLREESLWSLRQSHFDGPNEVVLNSSHPISEQCNSRLLKHLICSIESARLSSSDPTANRLTSRIKKNLDDYS